MTKEIQSREIILSEIHPVISLANRQYCLIPSWPLSRQGAPVPDSYYEHMKYPKEALVLFTEKGFVDENHNNANLIAIQFSYLIISMNCRWMTKTSFAKVWDRYKKELTFIRKTAPITEGLVYGSPEYEEMIRDVP